MEVIDYSRNFQFDIFIASICLSVSNLTIINILGSTIDSKFQDLLLVTLATITALRMGHKNPEIRILLNQVANIKVEDIEE